MYFLGHVIDEHGITPVPEKVETIKDFHQPTSLRQLRRFLGLINYYRRFIPGYATILTPLTDILHNQKRKNAKIQLQGETLRTFHQAKKALADFTKISYITDDENEVLTLTTDALEDSIGAVLHQESNGQYPSFLSQRRRSTVLSRENC